MKRILLFVLFFVPVVCVTAHPGIGIAEDGNGNILFTDLVHVWKIAPDGKKSIAGPLMHTHELFDLWLLETTVTNDVRVERVTSAGKRFVY